MITSLLRIIAIGRNTLVEAVRQKVLSVLLIFALVLVASSVFVSQIATPGLDSAGLFDEQIKFVKDFGCGAIGLFGFFIALLSTAQLIPQELHNRTIYTILAKPVRRAEFLLGKFLGVVLLVALSVALMALAFAATLYWQEVRGLAYTDLVYSNSIPLLQHADDEVHDYERGVAQIQASGADPAAQETEIRALDAKFSRQQPQWDNYKRVIDNYDRDVAHIHAQVRDPRLIEAVLLLFAKLIMTTAIALLISTFATSSIFTIVTTFMIYLIGHLESVARDAWLQRGAEMNIWQSGLLGLLSLLVPDMNSFTIVDEILDGHAIPWSHTINLLGYANVYLVVLLALSVIIFDYREI